MFTGPIHRLHCGGFITKIKRSAVVRVYSNGKTVNIRRPIKLLYPVELTEEIEKEPIDISGPQITSVMEEHVVDFIS